MYCPWCGNLQNANDIAVYCDNRNSKSGKSPDSQPLGLETVGFVRFVRLEHGEIASCKVRAHPDKTIY